MQKIYLWHAFCTIYKIFWVVNNSGTKFSACSLRCLNYLLIYIFSTNTLLSIVIYLSPQTQSRTSTNSTIQETRPPTATAVDWDNKLVVTATVIFTYKVYIFSSLVSKPEKNTIIHIYWFWYVDSGNNYNQHKVKHWNKILTINKIS